MYQEKAGIKNFKIGWQQTQSDKLLPLITRKVMQWVKMVFIIKSKIDIEMQPKFPGDIISFN